MKHPCCAFLIGLLQLPRKQMIIVHTGMGPVILSIDTQRGRLQQELFTFFFHAFHYRPFIKLSRGKFAQAAYAGEYASKLLCSLKWGVLNVSGNMHLSHCALLLMLACTNQVVTPCVLINWLLSKTIRMPQCNQFYSISSLLLIYDQTCST